MIKGISGLFNSGLSICDLTSLLFTTVAFAGLTVESPPLPPLLLLERVAIDDVAIGLIVKSLFQSLGSTIVLGVASFTLSTPGVITTLGSFTYIYVISTGFSPNIPLGMPDTKSK